MKHSAEDRPASTNWIPRAIVLAGLLAYFFALKLDYDPAPIGHGRPDSTFYWNLARNVAEGNGLRTNVSLYHQGLHHLPARTTIYPLWPLVAGYVARVVGLERAATLLPETLYLVGLGLLYWLAMLLARDARVPPVVSIRGVALVDIGHLAVFALGMARPYFSATSICMTEGLAFVLLFAALIALRGAPRRPVVFGALSGALAMLAFLARAQFILLPVAIVAALAIVGVREARLRRAAVAAALAAAVAFAPWALWVLSLPGAFDPRSFFIFTAYQETPALGTTSDLIVFDSLFDRVAYMLGGVRVAFDPTSETSYFRAFGASIYLVPLALVALLPTLVRRVREREGFGIDSLMGCGVLLAAGACLLPVHALNTTYPKNWFFHARHGLPIVLAILFALHVLVARGIVWRVVALVLALSIVANWTPERRAGAWRATPTLLTADTKDTGMWPVERELVAWLDAPDVHAAPPVCAAIKCRELAGWSRAGFHWLRADLAPDTPRRMFELLDELDYLLVYDGERRFDVFGDVDADFERVKRFRRAGKTIDVLRPKPGR